MKKRWIACSPKYSSFAYSGFNFIECLTPLSNYYDISISIYRMPSYSVQWLRIQIGALQPYHHNPVYNPSPSLLLCSMPSYHFPSLTLSISPFLQYDPITATPNASPSVTSWCVACAIHELDICIIMKNSNLFFVSLLFFLLLLLFLDRELSRLRQEHAVQEMERLRLERRISQLTGNGDDSAGDGTL